MPSFLLRSLLSGLAVALAWASQPGAVPCVERKRFDPCVDCKVQEWLEVMRDCQRHVSDIPSPNSLADSGPENMTIVYNAQLQAGRFGNLLGGFFTAQGLAMLTGLPIHNPDPGYNYHGIRLPIPPALTQRTGPYLSRLSELRHYCQVCPISHPYPHESLGMWMLADIPTVLHNMFGAEEVPAYDVVIQFRCSDSHASDGYGLLPLRYYLHALTGRVNTSTRVAILPDPAPRSVHCCMAMPMVLLASIRFLFNCTVELIYPSTVTHDFAIMLKAKVFVGSSSTFGLFAAIGNRGFSFLPTSSTLVRETFPCFDGVQWINVRANHHACTTPLRKWFVEEAAHPDLAHHLSAIFKAGASEARRSAPIHHF